MNTYKLLLDQIHPYLNNNFNDLPVRLQKWISTVGMGEETKDIYDGVEEVEWIYIEAEQRYFVGEEAEKNEVGGIKKSKGIRPRIRTERFYIWDRLSPLEREYKVAKYDFENYPGPREETASKKLAEAIKPYLETEFSHLPQPLKMNIAYVDDFMSWNKEDIHTRESLAQLFDIRMLPDSEPGFLIGRYGIRNVWAKYAKKYELLAEEAIPLMNGLDPESWQEHTINQKGLPKDMVDSIRRCLRIAEAGGIIKDSPIDWLGWGRKHDLDKPTIRSNERVPEPNVCMFGFFESAVYKRVKEINKSQDLENMREPMTEEFMGVKGIDKRKVMAAFQDIKWNYNYWGKNLASPSKKLEVCRVARGNTTVSSLWNPVSIGLYLLDERISLKELDNVFLSNLKDWSDEWREKTELERD